MTQFNRKMFKDDAKRALIGRYWYAFLVCLITMAIAGGLGLGGGRSGGGPFSQARHQINPHLIWLVAGIAALGIMIALVIGLGYMFFVANPFTVGKTKFFLDSRGGKCELGNIVYAFRGGHYLNVVKGMAWRFLFQFLWMLLFIIPGIVKYYAYFMVPYILSDNPDIGYERALKLSMGMTRGYKGRIFVMQLSFIGWYLLGMFCLMVGTLFVHPYYEASLAEMYVALRNNAVSSGLCGAGELNL